MGKKKETRYPLDNDAGLMGKPMSIYITMMIQR